jgi:hypothetical protein
MIIEAVVKIELKSDGTWQIVGLKALTETKLPEEQPPKPKPGVIESHFVNRDRIRKKRALEKNPRGPRKPHHCSQCGKAHRNILTCPHDL